MEEVEVLDFDNKPKKKKRKLKKKIKLFLILIILLIIILGGYGTYNYLLSSPNKKSEIIEFTVDDGSSVYLVGTKLKKENLIRSELAYKIYVKLNKINSYKAGIYILDKSYSTRDIVGLLSGDVYKKSGVTITFKEGNNIRGIVKSITSKTNITESEIYSLLSNKEYINSLIDKYWFLTDDINNEDIYYPLEGYLFPDTYNFGKDPKLINIFEAMLNQTDKVLSKYKSQIDSSSYSINELVTLASLIEKEGIYNADRKKIAGVFYNRLKSGMSLGSDVTTYYAFKIELSDRDLTSTEINTYNPYNTRGPKMNGKLPVGAISNFSEGSFEAALNPSDNDYYYFVADKSGKTHFTKTYEEHMKVIKELKESGNWIEW